jgi:hypothetical protein
VRYLTSNEIWALAGTADTAWMLTSGGINYTVDNGADTLSWQGWKTDLRPFALAVGGGRTLVCLGTTSDTIANDLWLYDRASGKDTTVAVPFRRRNLAPLNDAVEINVALYCADVVWGGGSIFWLAAVDGGLIRWDNALLKGRIFPVNVARSYAVDSFPVLTDTLLRGFPDTTKRVEGLDVVNAGTDSARVFVRTARRIWSFRPADSTWDTLPNRLADAGRRLVSFAYVKVNGRSVPPGLFTVIADSVSGGSRVDTMLYKYDPAGGQWVAFLTRDIHRPAMLSVTFGADGSVFFADTSNVYHYPDTAGTARLPYTDAQTIADKSAFDRRLLAATDVLIPHRVIHDVACTPDAAASRLWIASADGLYYSRDEAADESALRAFRYYRRSPKVTEGLKSAYVYPGILTNQSAYNSSGNWGESPRATFAYNLAKKANVTIRVYDWNMDLVKTIIDNQPRLAGTSRQMGRSTEPSVDYWDATDGAGRTVAPGVYYYKITTDAGERAFGKIVVAVHRF